jgi:competence protein ComEC
MMRCSRLVAFVASIVCVFCSAHQVRAATMVAHFIDVGQGAATLLEFPCGAVLIDAGGETSNALHFSSNARLKAYLDEFFQRRADLDNTLNLVVLSHPHTDHTRGVAELLKEANGYDIRNVVDNAQNTGSGKSQQLALRKWAKANADYKGMKLRDVTGNEGYTSDIVDPLLECDGVDPRIRILWGTRQTKPVSWTQEEFDDENNHSVVVRVDFGEASFLFPGDLEQRGESDLVKKYRNTDVLKVDVYQAGHHGSHTSSWDELLDEMSPEIVVMPSGASSRQHGSSAWAYGHPRDECVDRILPRLTRTRPPVVVPVATSVKTFETRTIDKALYAIGWDGAVLIRATDDGTLTPVIGQ